MHIAHGAIGIHRHCTIGWCAHDGHHTCWRTVFGIGVVALDRYHHGVTFVHRRCVVIRHWRNTDDLIRRRRTTLAIADAVVKAFLTAKACVRGEGNGALGINVYHTVRGVDLLCGARGQGHAIDRGDGQWVAICIGIICQWV